MLSACLTQIALISSHNSGEYCYYTYFVDEETKVRQKFTQDLRASK